jgi:PAS domain S-box-containing protein
LIYGDHKMKDEEKTREQLTAELEELRRRVTEMEAIEVKQMASEAALKQAEQEKETILDGLVEHVVYHDLEMRVLWANRAACDSVGMTREELLGRHCYEIWARRSEPCEDCPVKLARQTGQPQAIEKTTIDGRSWYIQASAVRDGNGDIVGMVELTLDITERKRIEEELRNAHLRAYEETQRLVEERTAELAEANKQLKQEIEQRKQAENALVRSEGQYRLLVQSASEGIVVSQDKILKLVNPKAVEISGYSEEELISKPFIEFVHPEDRDMLMHDHLRRLGGEEEPEEYEFRIVDKAGNTKWVRNNGVIIEWQGRPATLNLLSDITQNKLSEEQLIKTERLLYNTFDALQDLLIVIDKDLRVVMSNWKDHDYISPEEREGNPHCYACFMCRDTPCEPCHALEVFATGEIRELERTNPLDGKTREIRVLPIFGDDGQVIMVVEHLRDITLRKQAEEHIGRLSQELIRAQEAERQRLASDLHDRLAQDLACLKIGLDTLDQQEAADERRQKVSELSRLIQTIIMAVRDMAYGLYPPSLDEFGLVYTIRRYCEDFAGENGLTINFFSVGMDSLNLDFDAEMTLYRSVQEGLTNIKKHADASHVDVRLSASFSHIMLHIEDNGKGFEVDRRMKAAFDEKRMGLWGMEQRVASLDGEMKIESGPMHGTKILIKFPYSAKTNG